MKDVQNEEDARGISINLVGIKNLMYPICVSVKPVGEQSTVAEVSMGVSLSELQKGVHMSRFVEVLNEQGGVINSRKIPLILEDLCKVQDSKHSEITMRFPYFMQRESPVSKKKSLFGITATFEGIGNFHYNVFVVDNVIVLDVPVTSLCPCSKEISERGAHNQRGIISLSVSLMRNEFIWFEELVQYAENAASCEIYPLLKRPDEKYVTEKAYDNPAFVEDILRDLSLQLEADKRIKSYSVEVTNHESIHTHNAFSRRTK